MRNGRRKKKKGPGAAAVILEFLAVIYMLAVPVYLTVGLLSVVIRHTALFPASGPVGIQSGRGDMVVIGLVLSASVLFTPAFVHFAAMVRGRIGASIVLASFFGLLTLIHMFSALSIGRAYGRANLPGMPNNPGRSIIYCCAPDVFADSMSQCDNGIPCILPIDGFPDITVLPASHLDLDVNTNFKIIMGFIFSFVGLDLIMLVLLVLSTLGRGGEHWKWNALRYVESKMRAVGIPMPFASGPLGRRHVREARQPQLPSDYNPSVATTKYAAAPAFGMGAAARKYDSVNRIATPLRALPVNSFHPLPSPPPSTPKFRVDGTQSSSSGGGGGGGKDD